MTGCYYTGVAAGTACVVCRKSYQKVEHVARCGHCGKAWTKHKGEVKRNARGEIEYELNAIDRGDNHGGSWATCGHCGEGYYAACSNAHPTNCIDECNTINPTVWFLV